MGSDIKKPFNNLMQGIGLKDTPEAMGGDLNSMQSMLSQDLNSNPLYQANQKQALGNVLSTIASQKSLMPSEQANLASRTNRDMQMDALAQGNLANLEQRKLLADFLLQRSGGQMANKNASSQRMAGLMGAGLSAAGAAAAGKKPSGGQA